MIISVPPTLAFKRKDHELQRAMLAGWTRTDLTWERLMERASEQWYRGNPLQTELLLHCARFLAWRHFPPDDIRHATIAANMAIIKFHRQQTKVAHLYQQKALGIWQHAFIAIEAMHIAPRTRSSVFHLRMEAKYRDTYHNNIRTRVKQIAQETEETMQTLHTSLPSKYRHYSRWKGERPGVFDDTRKILGACLLIIEPKRSF